MTAPWEYRMCWLPGPQRGAREACPELWALLLLFPRGTHFQDVGEQGWILLDLGAEDSGELHLLLFCEGSRNCPTKSEKFLEGKKRSPPPAPPTMGLDSNPLHSAKVPTEKMVLWIPSEG